MDRKLRKILLKVGATVEVRNGGHYMIRKPGHQPVICSASPSDPRSRKNLDARLRREGYLPPKGHSRAMA